MFVQDVALELSFDTISDVNVSWNMALRYRLEQKSKYSASWNKMTSTKEFLIRPEILKVQVYICST